MEKKEFVPKPLDLTSVAAHRLAEFHGWVDGYNGLDSPIGVEGLDRLHKFVKEYLPHIRDGQRPEIELVEDFDVQEDVGMYWMELHLVSVGGFDWGQMIYFNQGHWAMKVPGQTERFVDLHALMSPEKMARVHVDAFLLGFATVFTARAQKVQRKGSGEDIFEQSWKYQRDLLRVAIACEEALVLLCMKSGGLPVVGAETYSRRGQKPLQPPRRKRRARRESDEDQPASCEAAELASMGRDFN